MSYQQTNPILKHDFVNQYNSKINSSTHLLTGLNSMHHYSSKYSTEENYHNLSIRINFGKYLITFIWLIDWSQVWHEVLYEI